MPERMAAGWGADANSGGGHNVLAIDLESTAEWRSSTRNARLESSAHAPHNGT